MKTTITTGLQDLVRGKYSHAIDSFSQSSEGVAREIGLSAAYFNLGISTLSIECINNAIHHGRNAVKQYGSSFDAHILLAQAHAILYGTRGQEQDRRKALFHYETAERSASERPDFSAGYITRTIKQRRGELS